MRPKSSNADQWHLFLSDHKDALQYVAVQIVEAIEEAERTVLQRAVDRMGWPEINAFREDMRKGQDVYEDAGGYFKRGLRCLFGFPRQEDAEVITYRKAAARAVRRSRP